MNGQNVNSIDINWPNREICVEVEGNYVGQINMDLEISLLTETDILVAKRVQSLSTGKTLYINNSNFKIKETITLPPSFTNGNYKLNIQLSHPRVAYLAELRNYVNINIDGNFTPQGISIDQKYFGMLYL